MGDPAATESVDNEKIPGPAAGSFLPPAECGQDKAIETEIATAASICYPLPFHYTPRWGECLWPLKRHRGGKRAVVIGQSAMV